MIELVKGSLLLLMRFLKLRLEPKAATAPKRGRGPGTEAGFPFILARPGPLILPVKGPEP